MPATRARDCFRHQRQCRSGCCGCPPPAAPNGSPQWMWTPLITGEAAAGNALAGNSTLNSCMTTSTSYPLIGQRRRLRPSSDGPIEGLGIGQRRNAVLGTPRFLCPLRGSWTRPQTRHRQPLVILGLCQPQPGTAEYARDTNHLTTTFAHPATTGHTDNR